VSDLDDLIPDGAAAAFADMLVPTGAAATLARVQSAAKRQADELAPVSHLAPQEPHEHDYRGQLSTPEALRRYVLGGHGILTLVSRRTGQRFTFKLSEPRKNPGGRLFVSVLTGPQNTADYEWLGTLWTQPSEWRGRTYPPRFNRSNRSRIGENAPSARSAVWLFDRVVRGSDEDLAALLTQADVWHEGACGRCGRKLTVPESVASGIGPTCAEKAA